MSTHPNSPSSAHPLTPRDHLRRWTRIALGSIRYWPALAVAAFLAVVAGFVAPRIVKPVYQSSTVLLHRELISTTSVLGARSYEVESGLQRNTRLKEMLLSRTSLQKIVEELGLYPDIVADQGIIEAVDQLRRDTECKVGTANTFAITYNGEDPEVVFKVIQRLGETLIEQSATYRREQAESTKEFLEAQHAGTRKELAASEQSLAEFLAQHPEFAYDMTAGGLYAPGASLRAEKSEEDKAAAIPRPAATVEIDPMLLALERQADRLRRRLKADDELTAAPAPAPKPVVLPPTISPKKKEAIDEAEREVDRAEQDLASIQRQYTSKHPDVIAAQGRVNSARAALRAAKVAAISPELDPGDSTVPAPSTTPLSGAERTNLTRRLASVHEQIAKARSHEGKGKVPAVVAEMEDDGSRIVALETQWAAVNRELDAIRERDQRIQRQLFEASIVAKVEASGNAVQMVTIDEPFQPERPARRGPRRTTAVAAILVMVLGFGIALLLSILDDRPQDEVDLRRLNVGPIAQTIPFSRARAQRSHG